jgi:hypothetical protein
LTARIEARGVSQGVNSCHKETASFTKEFRELSPQEKQRKQKEFWRDEIFAEPRFDSIQESTR